MPFDGSNYSSGTGQILRKAYARLSAGWIQKSLARRGSGTAVGFCVLGSVKCDDLGKEQELTVEMVQALSLIKAVIAQDANRIATVIDSDSQLAGWNDVYGRRKCEVLGVVATAMILQEQLDEQGTTLRVNV